MCSKYRKHLLGAWCPGCSFLLVKSSTYRSDLALQYHAGISIFIKELDFSCNGCESRLVGSSWALAVLAGETHMFLLHPHNIELYVVSCCDHEWNIRCIVSVYKYRKHRIPLDGGHEDYSSATLPLSNPLSWWLLRLDSAFESCPSFVNGKTISISCRLMLIQIQHDKSQRWSYAYVVWSMCFRFKVTRLKCLSWCPGLKMTSYGLQHQCCLVCLIVLICMYCWILNFELENLGITNWDSFFFIVLNEFYLRSICEMDTCMSS